MSAPIYYSTLAFPAASLATRREDTACYIGNRSERVATLAACATYPTASHADCRFGIGGGMARSSLVSAGRISAICFVVLLTGCTTTIPVAVIGKNIILRGENTFGVSGGSFSVTDGNLTCTGSYNALNQAATITIPILCSDGRTGIAMSTRDSAHSGGGKVRLTDGSEWDFIFGEGARRI
jgi:hypothetical protein